VREEMKRKTVDFLKVVKVRERVQEYNTQIRSSLGVSDFMKNQVWKDGEPIQEGFWVICLNATHRVMGICKVAQGTLTECLIMPADALRPAILYGSPSVVLVHNHPSGDPSPSAEDRLITIRICEAGRILGVKVLDHVIVGTTRFHSFKDDGLIE